VHGKRNNPDYHDFAGGGDTRTPFKDGTYVLILFKGADGCNCQYFLVAYIWR
jgi:hypothetical protein